LRFKKKFILLDLLSDRSVEAPWTSAPAFRITEMCFVSIGIWLPIRVEFSRIRRMRKN